MSPTRCRPRPKPPAPTGSGRAARPRHAGGRRPAAAACGPGSPASAPASRAATRCSSRCSAPSGPTTPRPTWRCSSAPTRPPSSMHRGQMRKSGDPYITHPLAVTTILADIGMTEPTLVRLAAARHGRGHVVHPRPAAHRLRRRGGPAGRRRHQAGQGQVRRLGAVGDHPQDDRGDEPRHPGARDQAGRPAAQHAHAALPQAGDAGAQGPRDARDLRAAGPPARHEHHQVGARGPRVRHPAPEDLRRDRPAGRRARAVARPVPGRGDQPGRGRPARTRRSRPRSPGARSTTTRSTRR